MKHIHSIKKNIHEESVENNFSHNILQSYVSTQDHNPFFLTAFNAEKASF